MTRYEATFTVDSFVPTDWAPPPSGSVGLPFGEARMVKTFTGSVEGRAETSFIGAMSEDQTQGGYVAIEWFEGRIGGRSGGCAIVHSQLMGAPTTGPWLHVVPGSGTGQLAGLTGSGALEVDEDGTHRIWVEVPD
jgi:hypothetical protein